MARVCWLYFMSRGLQLICGTVIYRSDSWLEEMCCMEAHAGHMRPLAPSAAWASGRCTLFFFPFSVMQSSIIMPSTAPTLKQPEPAPASSSAALAQVGASAAVAHATHMVRGSLGTCNRLHTAIPAQRSLVEHVPARNRSPGVATQAGTSWQPLFDSTQRGQR